MAANRADAIKEAGTLKSGGRLHEAIVVCGELLQQDRYDPEFYSMTGKLYYLLEDYEAALRYFLTALHLEILHAGEERKKNESYRIESDALLEESTSPILKHLKKDDSLRFLPLFGHTLIHLAHSLADSSIRNQNVEEINIYREIISGREVDMSEKYKKMENGFYFHIGLIFSVSFIQSHLLKNDVITEYFSVNSSEIWNIYSESLNIFDKIR
ncbi:MAG: tetratricopeptide repeat protein [bacterium]